MRKILIIMLFLATFTLTVRAQEVPQSLFLEQAGSRTCTLCSATMMLRSCLYILGDDRWQQVTEDSVGVSAWTSDGLYWNWSYTIDENTITVDQQGCGGITVDELKGVLDNHPEGIVLYCGGSSPHAVFLTDCQNGTFYCADPAMGYAEKRIPLEESLLGDRHGGQAQILSAVSAYWYIASHNIEDRSYISDCQVYSTDYTIRVRWDGYAMSLPCTQEQREDSEKVFRIRSGETYTAQALLLNDAGQGWFCVGEDIYISAEDAQRAGGGTQTNEQRTDPQADEQMQVVPLLLSSENTRKNTTKILTILAFVVE